MTGREILASLSSMLITSLQRAILILLSIIKLSTSQCPQREVGAEDVGNAQLSQRNLEVFVNNFLNFASSGSSW